MSEEKRRILEMVQEGKITQEDAARLLEALGDEEDAVGSEALPGILPAGRRFQRRAARGPKSTRAMRTARAPASG